MVGVVAVVVGGVGTVGVGSTAEVESGVGSSTTFGGSKPFLTLISIDGKIVGPLAFRSTSLLPWARAFALEKPQFWGPDFHI